MKKNTIYYIFLFFLFFLFSCKNKKIEKEKELFSIRELNNYIISNKDKNKECFCIESIKKGKLYKVNDSAIAFMSQSDSTRRLFIIMHDKIEIYDFDIYCYKKENMPCIFDQYIEDWYQKLDKGFQISLVKKEYDKKVKKIIYKTDYKDSISVRIGNITDTKIAFYSYEKPKFKKFEGDGFIGFIFDYYTFRKNDLIDFSKVKFENCNKIFENQVK